MAVRVSFSILSRHRSWRETDAVVVAVGMSSLRSPYGKAHEQTVIARLGLLDGPGSRPTKGSHKRSRYLERGLFGRRDAHGGTSLGPTHANASYFQGAPPFFYRGFASPRRLHVPVIDWSIRETCDPVGYLGRRSRFLNKDVRDRPRGAAERRRASSAWMVGYQETGGGVRWESWQGDRADDRGYGVRLPPPLTMPRSS